MTDTKKTDRPVLEVEKRKIKGRKVKNLRQEKILPANIYGKEIKSLAVQTSLTEAKKVYEQAGETGLVDLKIKEEKKSRPVLLHNLQTDPVSDELIHLDFYQVDLTQKVTADIPVEISGKAPAAEKGEGVLVHLVNEIEAEALPADLPEKLVVSVDSLEKIDQAIALKEALEKSGWEKDKVEVKTSLELLLVKIEAPAKEEAVEEKPAEEEATPTEGAEEQKEEKETPAEPKEQAQE
ncbi:MAG: 50S ribosomal protein L25 [Candidatus Shapirobacteria bacterium]